jgi:hypothetical protein
MKKILLLLVVGLFPVFVYADSISVSCNKTTVSPGETITCNISGTTSSAVNGVSAKVILNNLTFQSFSKSSVWNGDGNNGEIDLYTSDNQSGTFAIGTLTLKVGSANGTITLGGLRGASTPEYSNADFETVNVTSSTLNITVSNPTPTPTPTPTPEPTPTSDPTPAPANNQNNNTPKEQKSDNNYLRELGGENVSISFDKTVSEYSFEVSNDVENFELVAIPEDGKSMVSISNQDHLVDGLNQIKVLVVAENGSTREYTLNVTRLKAEETSSNNNLSDLRIKGYYIEFNPNKTDYSIVIKKETSLSIDYLTESEKATVKIEGNEDLKKKDAVKVIVTAENGDVKTYTINITREGNKIVSLVCVSAISFFIGVLFGLVLKKIIRINKKKTV